MKKTEKIRKPILLPPHSNLFYVLWYKYCFMMFLVSNFAKTQSLRRGSSIFLLMFTVEVPRKTSYNFLFMLLKLMKFWHACLLQFINSLGYHPHCILCVGHATNSSRRTWWRCYLPSMEVKRNATTWCTSPHLITWDVVVLSLPPLCMGVCFFIACKILQEIFDV